MSDNLVVNSWVGVRDGCEITWATEDGDSVHFAVSDGVTPPFEFAFQAGALRTFLAAGSSALASLAGERPA